MSAAAPPIEARNNVCRILSLDGGGAKGFYTLGVLKQVEAMLGDEPLCERFNLIFGTSTGAIIAALLALGNRVDSILELYKKYVPAITGKVTTGGRTKALAELVEKVFGKADFTQVKTGVGIVATHWIQEKPMIFKNDVGQAHGSKATFVPGFGCTIAQAVRASCSAYPYFKRVRVKTSLGAEVEVFDGGYCANNPTLYAIADAVKALEKDYDDIRVLSIGVGMYPEPKRWINPKHFVTLLEKIFLGFTSLELLQKTLNVNTTSMEQLRSVLFKDIPTVRINQEFTQPEMATHLLESDLNKLNILYQRGTESFGAHEPALKALFA
jgi:predicted patatin/cPLA2 family phospholipase